MTYAYEQTMSNGDVWIVILWLSFLFVGAALTFVAAYNKYGPGSKDDPP